MALRWVQGSVGNFSDREQTVQKYISTTTVTSSSSTSATSSFTAYSQKALARLRVVDPAGQWMSRWNYMFEALEIPFLRSTMFMHPDPFDLYSFLAFAYATGRQSELNPITELYCEHQPVDQKRKKKDRCQFKGFSNFPENRRELFFRPSQLLFRDYCNDLVEKYNLSDRVTKGSVTSIDTLQNGRYCLKLDSGETIEAKYVVFSTGFSQPLIPDWLPSIKQQLPSQVMHSGEWCKERPHINICIKGKRVLIVGGGLTSAHLVAATVKRGCDKVVLVSRKYLVTKLFDLGLEWMGTCRNLQYAKFWNHTDYAKRLEMIKAARGGGSITYEARKNLNRAEEDGALKIYENCTIEKAEAVDGVIRVTFSNGTEPQDFDFVWTSTGSKINILSEPYLQSYLSKHSIETQMGFPVLDQDLKLNPKHNIFVMGGYASMQLGPDARNLSGCRNAADRICVYIEDLEISQNTKNTKNSERSENFESSKSSENSRDLKNSNSSKKKSAKNRNDGNWANYGNEGFNSYSLLSQECAE